MRARRLLILWCVAASSLANAGNRIVVLTDPAQSELPRALEVALANRHVDVTSLAPPEGALRLDRAAVVQRAAIANTADAGVWIDVDAGETDVCVVSSDGKLRHAPLPADVPPRVFAAIAASLLDELLAPPESPPISVDVYVDVHTNPAPPVMSPPPSRSHVVVMVPPGESSTVIAHAPFEPDAPWHRSRLEVGVTASLVTYGVEAELLLPVADSVRIGVLGGFNWLYGNLTGITYNVGYDGVEYVGQNETMADAGLELRYSGHGQNHVELGVASGVFGGAVSPITSELCGFGSVRLGITHEYARSAVSAFVSPTVLVGFGNTTGVVPGVMTSLRWELPI